VVPCVSSGRVGQGDGPSLKNGRAISTGQPNTAARDLVAAKQASWRRTAARVKQEDPDAYACLTGARPDRPAQALAAALPLLLLLPLPLTAFLFTIPEEIDSRS
jgi:hypothetical protein